MYYTKPLVKAILEKPLQYQWSLQGLGMLRLYLSDEVRLHVWDDRYRLPNVTPLHTHPWDFLSTVVAGMVTNIRYKYTDDKFGIPYSRYGINCGAGAKVQCADKVYLTMGNPEYHKEGDSYFERYDEIHDSKPLRGTVTIVNRIFRKDKDSAYVFEPYGNTFVSAEPRPAKIHEVLDITKNALNTFFKGTDSHGETYEAVKKYGTTWGVLENWGSRG